MSSVEDPMNHQSSDNASGDVASSTIHVPAMFGRRNPQEDPTWERAFSQSLKDSHTPSGLLDLFVRFRSGEGSFDSMMRRVVVRAMCKQVGNDLQIGPDVIFKHPETIEFGDCVFVGAQTMLQGRINGHCKIGSHVWIGPQAYFDARHLILEDYVGWGPGAKVLGSVHTGIPIGDPIITTGLVIKPVTVGFGADIGMNATILPGVRIGAHSIVGAGAVVTHDVPEYAVVAGIPARMLRDRRDEGNQ